MSSITDMDSVSIFTEQYKREMNGGKPVGLKLPTYDGSIVLRFSEAKFLELFLQSRIQRTHL